MASPLLKKLGYKRGMRSILVGAPEDVAEAIALPGDDTANRLAGMFDLILLFVKTCKELESEFPRKMARLNLEAMLWIAWPKGGRLGTDLSLQNVIRIGYDHGMVESKTVSLNDTWSAIKFTFPKDGRQYNNSYGKLP